MTDLPRRHLDRRRFLVAGLGALLAACAGGTGDDDPVASGSTADSSPSPDGPSTPTSSDTSSSPSPSPSASTFNGGTPEGAGEDLPTGIVPTRIEIPAIDVDVQSMNVNLTADEVEVPDFGLAGWWVQTRKPGEIGPAVIGGHVDSKSGPDVFFRLKELRPGDEVTVYDEAGESRTFTVNDEPLQINKYERPAGVFGFGEGRPELRLITCGGEFDPSIGSYDDNIVVFAHDTSYEA